MLSKKAKLSNEKTFIAGGHIFECSTYKSPYSWGHYVEVYSDDYRRIDDLKCTYYNRTWESYCYQSILHEALRRNGLDEYKKEIDAKGTGNVKQELKAMGGIVAMAGLLQDNPKDKNDRELKALELVSGGLVTRPDDWETLTTEDQAKRLAKAKELLN